MAKATIDVFEGHELDVVVPNADAPAQSRDRGRAGGRPPYRARSGIFTHAPRGRAPRVTYLFPRP
jgi:hypothetical protein